MTGFWLFLSAAFKWSFHFFDKFGYIVNWILFFTGCALFVYWCWQLIFPLGNAKDKTYKSPSKETRPYYDPKIYNKEG
jgi:hypothetical protein